MGGGDQSAAVFVGPPGGGLDHFLDEADVEAGAFEEAVERAVFEIVREGGGGVGVGEIGAAQVDDDAHGRGGEKLVHVPARIGDGFEDEDGFEEEVGLGGAEGAERGGAGLGVDEEVDGVLHECVVGREEADILADDGAGAVEGGEHAVARDRGKRFHVGVAGVEEDVAGLVVLDADAEVVEEVVEEVSQERVGVDFADPVDDAGGDVAVEGVELEEAVAALFHF